VTAFESYLATFDEEPGYLDWAAFGPLAPAVRAEVHADAEILGTGRRSGIDLVFEHEREAASLVAELLGAPADQVVLQPSTTLGLMHALYGLSGGVVVSRGEFASLAVTAARAEAAMGTARVQWIEPPAGFVTPDAVRDALTDDTTAVAVSLVDFRTGYRADLSALRDVIGDRLLIVDAMQGFGAVPADYAAADVVCGNGFKWLRAGRGTGFAFYGPRAVERLAPVLSGFQGADGGLPVDVVPPPSLSARAFRISGADPLAASRLASALREVVAVGVEAIGEELTARTADVIYLADRYEIPVLTPREPARRAGIVALAPAPHETGSLAASLTNHGLTVTARAGTVRVSPHVGTGADTLRLLGDALAEFAANRAW
jgi:selenocysteine lyase/cysteine desulfurase